MEEGGAEARCWRELGFALQIRERAHDIGVYKSIGMTPRQTLAMIVWSVAFIGLIAGIVAIPAGVYLHHGVLPVMALEVLSPPAVREHLFAAALGILDALPRRPRAQPCAALRAHGRRDA